MRKPHIYWNRDIRRWCYLRPVNPGTLVNHRLCALAHDWCKTRNRLLP